MNQLLLLILGIFLSVIGIVNISGNISTIHAYNRRNVKEEDVPKYGKAVGTGTLIIGISLALAYLVTLWNESNPRRHRSSGNHDRLGIYSLWADQI